VISVNRSIPGRFSDHQTNLLKTFADQALIAIENVRLFNETREALERQTATAEVLRVISSSPTDTQPVFDAIAASALRLFGGYSVTVSLVQGDQIREGRRRGHGTRAPSWCKGVSQTPRPRDHHWTNNSRLQGAACHRTRKRPDQPQRARELNMAVGAPRAPRCADDPRRQGDRRNHGRAQSVRRVSRTSR
jgi:hypothetical protein